MINKLFIKKSLIVPLIFVLILLVIILCFIIFGDNITCSDWLVFTGAIIGGIASFSAIYLSYTQNEKYHQKAMMPFIILSPVEIIDCKLFLRINCESIYRGLFSVLNPVTRISAGVSNKVTIRNISFDNISELVHNMENNEYYFRKLTLKNIGAGTAYDISIKIQNQDGFKGLVLAKNEELKTLLEIDNTHDIENGKNYTINLTIEFCDITGRKYIQQSSCEVNISGSLPIKAPKNNPPKLL